MMKLISAEDALGALFYKKVSKLVDEIVQGLKPIKGAGGLHYTDTRPTDEILEQAGIQTFCYDGPRRDFFETGFVVATEAASQGTNLVLTWNEMGDELVTFFAKDEAEAKRKVDEVRKTLLALRRSGRRSAPRPRTGRRR